MMKKVKKKKTGKGKAEERKGIALIWTYMVSAFLLTTLAGFYEVTRVDTRLAAIDSQSLQAFYLAESGIDKIIHDIKSEGYMSANPRLITVGNVGSFLASYDAANHIITSTGTSGGVSKTVTVKFTITGTPPPGAHGALTISSPTQISGPSLFIDGGTPIAGLSYYDTLPPIDTGVSIGGNGTTPQEPANPLALNQLQSNETLTSAEAVLGAPRDSLLPYTHAELPGKTPLNNEIWVTNLNVTEPPTYDLGNGSGILVVLGGCEKNPEVFYTGTFTGLLISDGCISLSNAEIRGAVVYLGTDQNGIKGKVGTNKIIYDRNVLENLPTIRDAVYSQKSYSLTWTDSSNDGSNGNRLLEQADPIEEIEGDPIPL